MKAIMEQQQQLIQHQQQQSSIPVVSSISTIINAASTPSTTPSPLSLAAIATTTTSTTTPNSISSNNNNTNTNIFPANVVASPSSSSLSTNNLTTTASTTAASIANATALSSTSTSQQQQKSLNNIADGYTLPFHLPTTAPPSTSTTTTTTAMTTTQPSTSAGSTTIQQISGNSNNINITNVNNNNSSSSSSSSNSGTMMMTLASTSGLGLKPASVTGPTSTHQSQQSKRTGEQKRPMNAFLMFCKRHRSHVRDRNPSLENRGITKILGEWWSKLDRGQKSSYTECARQHKEAFMKANPDFKWYKTDLRPPINRNIGPASPATLNMASVTDMITNASRELLINNNVDPNVPVIKGPYVTKNNGDSATVKTTNSVSSSPKQIMNNTMEKNALTNNDERQYGAPKPPKKRYLENGQHMQNSSSSNSNDRWNSSTSNITTIYNNSSGISKLQINNHHTHSTEARQNNSKLNHCATKNSSNNNSEANKEDHMMSDTIVPVFFDKVTFDRVVEHAFSDTNPNNRNTTPSVVCDDLVNNINNSKPALSGIIDQTHSQQSAIKLGSSKSMASNDRNINKVVEDLGGNGMGAADLSIQRKQSIDEPVDFSMNRTYEATNQILINNTIDRMLSDSRDINNASLNLSLSNNNTSQPMDQDHQPNQQQLQQSSSALTSGTNSSNHYSSSNHMVAATNNSSFTNTSKTSVPEFDLEKKITELPLFELTNGKFEGIDQRQHDGLATLAEAAVAVQQLPPQLPQQQQQQHNPHSINVVKNDPAASLATLAAVAGQTPNTVVPAASLKD